jgi:hypothetical protein
VQDHDRVGALGASTSVAGAMNHAPRSSGPQLASWLEGCPQQQKAASFNVDEVLQKLKESSGK